MRCLRGCLRPFRSQTSLFGLQQNNEPVLIFYPHAAFGPQKHIASLTIVLLASEFCAKQKEVMCRAVTYILEELTRIFASARNPQLHPSPVS